MGRPYPGARRVIPAHIRAIVYREVMVNKRNLADPDEWRKLPMDDKKTVLSWLQEDERNQKRLNYYVCR